MLHLIQQGLKKDKDMVHHKDTHKHSLVILLRLDTQLYQQIIRLQVNNHILGNNLTRANIKMNKVFDILN